MSVRKACRVLAAVAMAVAADAQTIPGRPGGIKGSTFTTENQVERTFIPGARIRIEGVDAGLPRTAVSTDEAGRFLAADLPPGRYRVTADVSGLEAPAVEVAVQEATVAEIELELKPLGVKEEATVSAQAEVVDTTQAASKEVLQQSTLEHAPNLNERFESLLPLLPGVVRGPDGLINTKGERTSGAGYFSDRINLNIPTFTLLPGRQVTRYFADGTVSNSAAYRHGIAGEMGNPRSTAWNVEEYNPRDIQSNAASQRYGVFLDSVGRMVRGKFVVEF